MSAIIWDDETRQFSVVEDQREFGVKEMAGAVGGHLSRNSRAYIGAGSTAVGGAAGAAIARSKAKKAALAKGLEPGTPEYKKFIRNQTLKGAGIGAVAGGAASEGARLAKQVGKGVMDYRNAMKESGNLPATKGGKMAAFKAHMKNNVTYKGKQW